MKIAAHISSLQEQGILQTILQNVCKVNTDYKVEFFSDANIDTKSSNESFTKINIKPNKKIAQYIWTHYTLPSVFKKNIPNIFINEFGYCVNKINIPNFLFFSNKDFIKKLAYSNKKTFLQCLHFCKKIFVTEDFIKELLIEKYAIIPDKIITTYYPLLEKYKLLSYEQKDTIKKKYTLGFDYFLYELNNESANHAITILKAFSQFKKWQKSSIKLVFYTDHNNAASLINNFNLYKYKDDVVFVHNTKATRVEIVAAAFLQIYTSDYKANNITTIAMQNHVPIIALDTAVNRSLFENTVLYAAATDASIAAQIQLLYKDEFASNALQIEAAVHILKYDGEKVAEILFKHISTA